MTTGVKMKVTFSEQYPPSQAGTSDRSADLASSLRVQDVQVANHGRTRRSVPGSQRRGRFPTVNLPLKSRSEILFNDFNLLSSSMYVHSLYATIELRAVRSRTA